METAQVRPHLSFKKEMNRQLTNHPSTWALFGTDPKLRGHPHNLEGHEWVIGFSAAAGHLLQPGGEHLCDQASRESWCADGQFSDSLRGLSVPWSSSLRGSGS